MAMLSGDMSDETPSRASAQQLKVSPTKTTIFQCEVCKKTFTCAKHLQEHKEMNDCVFDKTSPHLDIVPSARRSNGMSDETLSPASAQQLKLSPTETTIFQCEVCMKTFTRANHVREHKEMNDCVSKKTFPKPYALQHHMSLPAGPQCVVCKKTFSRPAYLRRHLLTHFKPTKSFGNPKPPKKSSTQKIFLNAHLADKLHRCNVCEKSYLQPGSLRRHMQVHGPPTVVYPSDIYKKSFKRVFNVRQDTPKHTSVKLYPCDMCDKSFTRSNDRTRHMRTHACDKFHQCEICDESFANAFVKARHMEIHACVKPHCCDICGEAFVLSSNLRKHKLIHGFVATYQNDSRENVSDDPNKTQLTHIFDEDGKVTKEFVTNDIQTQPYVEVKPIEIKPAMNLVSIKSDDESWTCKADVESESVMISSDHNVRSYDVTVKDEKFEYDCSNTVVSSSNVNSELFGSLNTPKPNFNLQSIKPDVDSESVMVSFDNNEGSNPVAVEDEIMGNGCNETVVARSSVNSELVGTLKMEQINSDLSSTTSDVDYGSIMVSFNDNVSDNSVVLKEEKWGNDYSDCEIYGTTQMQIANESSNAHRQRSCTSVDSPPQHIPSHTNVETYECHMCKETYKMPGDLRLHLLTHSSTNFNQCDKMPNEYKCEVCQKTFTQASHLRVHIITHAKRHPCDICKKTFSRASYLRKHKKVHTGDTPHKCPICKAPFSCHSDLARHWQVHNKYDMVPEPKQIITHANDNANTKSITIKLKAHTDIKGEPIKIKPDVDSGTKIVFKFDMRNISDIQEKCENKEDNFDDKEDKKLALKEENIV